MTDPLRELGHQLPWDRPEPARVDSVRSALLVAAAEDAAPRRARRRWPVVAGAFAAGALAAAAVAVVMVKRGEVGSGSAPPTYAVLEASPSASLEHVRTTTATGTDEVIRVHAGTIQLAAKPVARGDHMRVETANASIEGEGVYHLDVVDDAVRRVVVTSGAVALQVKGQPRAIFLAAGQRWEAPVVTSELAISARDATHANTPAVDSPAALDAPPHAPSPPAQHDSGTPPSRPARAASPAVPRSRVSTSTEAQASPPSSSPPTTPTAPPSAAPQSRLPAVTELTPEPPAAPPPTAGVPTATEQHFRSGANLLRGGRFREAAIELGIAADQNDGPLAADARYFQGVALIKANQRAQAEAALVAFLDHAPGSIRRGRAALMVARLIADRGDRASARAWFEAASRDADPAVASAARAALSGRSPGDRVNAAGR